MFQDRAKIIIILTLPATHSMIDPVGETDERIPMSLRQSQDETVKAMKMIPLVRKLVAAAVVLGACSNLRADDWTTKGDCAFTDGRFSQAYDLWFPGAMKGDGELQEKMAMLLPGPNASSLKQ